MQHIAATIDHTFLKPEATDIEITALCNEAKMYQFASVCVPPNQVPLAVERLKGSQIKVCTVIGFPLGYATKATKVFETKDAILNGANEVDMVIAIGKLKEGDHDYVSEEIKDVFEACKEKQVILKVIVETALLTYDEKIAIYTICGDIGVDYVKTSTGFSYHGAKIEDIELMRKHLPDTIKIKASGGIKDATFAKELLLKGADRLGASKSVELIKA